MVIAILLVLKAVDKTCFKNIWVMKKSCLFPKLLPPRKKQ
jgi:hypothetical protein